MIVNPSWLYRLPHMLTAAYLTGSFLLAGIGAFYLLQGKHVDFGKRTVSLGMSFATVLIIGQTFIGDLLYGRMLEYQPAKMQAAEGFWDKQSVSPAPYYVAIVPDQGQQRNRAAFGIPYPGSIWLTHSLHGRVMGLRNTPVDKQPRMVIVFYAFRLMLMLAMIMFAISACSVWLQWKSQLYSTRWFLRILVFMTPAGVFATLGGWYVAEVGRQPWVIYGVLHTRDAVSPVPAGMLASTLIAFLLIYSVFITAFLLFALRAIRKGPIESHTHPDASGSLKNVFRPRVLDHPSIAFKLTGGKKG